MMISRGETTPLGGLYIDLMTPKFYGTAVREKVESCLYRYSNESVVMFVISRRTSIAGYRSYSKISSKIGCQYKALDDLTRKE